MQKNQVIDLRSTTSENIGNLDGLSRLSRSDHASYFWYDIKTKKGSRQLPTSFFGYQVKDQKEAYPRGPQPTSGTIRTLTTGVDGGLVVPVGVTLMVEPVFLVSNCMSGELGGLTCAEALMPNPKETTRANPRLREIDMYHTPTLWKQNLKATRYHAPIPGHIISYRQIYPNMFLIVKRFFPLLLCHVDFNHHITFSNMCIVPNI